MPRRRGGRSVHGLSSGPAFQGILARGQPGPSMGGGVTCATPWGHPGPFHGDGSARVDKAAVGPQGLEQRLLHSTPVCRAASAERALGPGAQTRHPYLRTSFFLPSGSPHTTRVPRPWPAAVTGGFLLPRIPPPWPRALGFIDPPASTPSAGQFPGKLLGFLSCLLLSGLPYFNPTAHRQAPGERPPAPLWPRGQRNSDGEAEPGRQPGD